MKKLLLVFVLGVFVFPSVSSAQSIVTGCTVGAKFSAITGAPCYISIESLTIENLSLKAQIARLIESNKSLNNQAMQCQDNQIPYFSVKKECSSSEEDIEYITRKISDAKKEFDKANPPQKGGLLSGAQQANSIRNQKFSSLITPLSQDLKAAQAKVLVYCN